MFQCNIELLDPLKQADGEPRVWVVGKYKFAPGIYKGEEVSILWEVGGKTYNLKTKVVGRKRVVHSPSIKLSSMGEKAVEEGAFQLRIIVEPEDRDAVVEIGEFIRHNNPRLYPQ